MKENAHRHSSKTDNSIFGVFRNLLEFDYFNRITIYWFPIGKNGAALSLEMADDSVLV